LTAYKAVAVPQTARKREARLQAIGRVCAAIAEGLVMSGAQLEDGEDFGTGMAQGAPILAPRLGLSKR